MSSLDSLYDEMGGKKCHVTPLSTIVINASSDHSPTSDAPRLLSSYVGHSLSYAFKRLTFLALNYV